MRAKANAFCRVKALLVSFSPLENQIKYVGTVGGGPKKSAARTMIVLPVLPVVLLLLISTSGIIM